MSKKAVKNEKVVTKPQQSYAKLLVFAGILGAVSACFVYMLLLTPPETPKLDFNEWWGQYPIDQKQDESIRPYKVEFSDVMINDLRERLLHRRPFTPPLEDAGFTYGFNSLFLTQVLDYWQNKYDFKSRENYINQYNHYITKVQGLDIHFLRVKPKNTADVETVPLLLLHGWPGSFREFYEMIPILITPRPEHDFVFEVIVPSLPGFGYSQSAPRPGLGPAQMAIIMQNLMKRLGFNQYYVQGGDLGHTVGSIMSTLFPANVLGFHTNFPAVLFDPIASMYIFMGSLWPSFMGNQEIQNRMYPYTTHMARLIEESGYMHIQATKPDTVGIGLSDSPAGLAAYILEKFSTWTNPEFKKARDGNLLEKYSLTHLLDNIMVYWTSNSITTSLRVYAETMNSAMISTQFDRIPTRVPTWGIKFKHELVYNPDRVLKYKYHNYLHSTVVEDGGHFAAMENPAIMADDVYQAVDTFRRFHSEENISITTPNAQKLKTVYDFTVKDINGLEISLDKYKGLVLLIVNVASQCGLTETNYKELNELHKKYYSEGLRILAFPCNQFNGQEPGTPNEILAFIKQKGVKFDLFEKVDVNGDNAHPMWKFLKETQGGTLLDAIKWNFSKFLVDRNGVPVQRFGPNVNPLELEPYIAKYL